ncbi:MAG: ornithine carbamoyltransferase [Phototrophicaceae bacterium]
MKHFLDLASWDTAEIKHILDLAVYLKKERQTGGNRPVLQNKILGMIFQKPSLRTRVSFEVAMNHLGGSAIMLGPQEIGLGKRESVPDVARVLSGFVDVIMARVFEHEHVTELAEWSRVPVINGLSDDYHPCQAMADMLTIYERLGHLEGVKVSYIGDGNNVAASLLYACAHFGCDFSIATPEGYELPQSVRDIAAPLIERSGINVTESVHIEPAIENADVLCTDTWISMGQEDEAQERRATFDGYQINDDLLSRTGKKSIVLHCLPAHRGEEITDSVMDGEQSAVFQQAENRLHAQKAILVHLLAHK